MHLPFRQLAVAVVCLGAAWTTSCAAAPPTTAKAEPVRLEFRRSEAEPAAGLTPAVVPGWDAPLFLHPTPYITNPDVAEARVVADSQGPNPVVELIFTSDGSKKMAALTQEHVGKRFAILLDGKVVSAPMVLATVSRTVQISGAFTRDEADALVKSLNAK